MTIAKAGSQFGPRPSFDMCHVLGLREHEVLPPENVGVFE
jgi:hypothetical protein